MHIQDGILSAQACAAYYGVTAAMVVPGIMEIKREQGNDGNKEPKRGRDERLGYPSGYSGRVYQTFVADQVEGMHHPGDRAEQS